MKTGGAGVLDLTAGVASRRNATRDPEYTGDARAERRLVLRVDGWTRMRGNKTMSEIQEERRERKREEE